jgi:sulfite reductase alpha subunit-like flavoprotein
LESAGALRIFTAFSRDQEHKVYVQHVIRRNSATVWEALEAGGVVMIAGSANQMPKNVTDVVQELVQFHGKMGVEDAVAYMATLEQTRRLQLETWS